MLATQTCIKTQGFYLSLFQIIIVLFRNTISHVFLLEFLTKLRFKKTSIFHVLIFTIEFSRTVSFQVQHKHAFKVKIIQIYIDYLMYKHLCVMALSFDVAFLLPVSIY